MLQGLLVLWIATLGADRIDVAAGHSFFIATPFLVLTPLVLFAYVITVFFRRRNNAAPFSLPKYFFVLLSVFLLLGLTSVIFGTDVERGAVAYALLFYEAICVTLISTILCAREDSHQLLLRGAHVGILLCLIFSVIELINWFLGNLVDASPDRPKAFVLLAAHSIGIIVPRLSAVSWDPNRTGLLLLFYWFLTKRLGRGRADKWYSGLALILLFLTLSRSAIVSWLATSALLSIRKKRSFTGILKWKWKPLASSALVVTAIAALIYFGWAQRTTLDNLDAVVSDRLSVDGDNTSGGIHRKLFERGLEIWSTTPKNELIGVGYGSSARFLTDIFGETKYGNFHCLYISVLVECGAFALLILLLLIVFPTLRNSAWTPFVGGVLLFNVSYQTTSEPYFWLFITLMWITRETTALARSANRSSYRVLSPIPA